MPSLCTHCCHNPIAIMISLLLPSHCCQWPPHKGNNEEVSWVLTHAHTKINTFPMLFSPRGTSFVISLWHAVLEIEGGPTDR
jgi:hypothetical protein